jgi:2,4-dienoyl-CoA reductase-like NADH-dependent reductase (Old Yellow Enzyme family)
MGMQPEAPSPIIGPLPTGHAMDVPEEMSIARIHEVVDEFAQAARRSKEGGFDLVEVHAAHGYLLSQFISPYSNIRTDAYGGSLENRLRMVLETLEAVRGAVGPDYPVGIRLNGDDMVDGGYTLDEYQVVAQLIERSGFVDYISVQPGSTTPMQWRPWLRRWQCRSVSWNIWERASVRWWIRSRCLSSGALKIRSLQKASSNGAAPIL